MSSTRYYSSLSGASSLHQDRNIKSDADTRGGVMLTRKMFRNPKITEGPRHFANMMADRRICRGSTFTKHKLPPIKVQSEAARRAEAKKNECLIKGRMGTPPAVQNRRHEPVQTERYLEEICDRPVESEKHTQTDLFEERPETPPFVPSKTGVDTETQIYPGELFNFDIEVVPIIEVLVGKTVEQALIEVLEEDEIAEMQAQQKKFAERRAAEKVEQQRLEEEEKKLVEEKNKRMLEREAALRIQKETEERVAAAMLSEGFITDLLPDVLEGLEEAGYLADNVKKDLENNFMPWLMEEVKSGIEVMLSTSDIIGEIVREILESKYEIYTKLGDSFYQEDEEILGEEYETY